MLVTVTRRADSYPDRELGKFYGRTEEMKEKCEARFRIEPHSRQSEIGR